MKERSYSNRIILFSHGFFYAIARKCITAQRIICTACWRISIKLQESQSTQNKEPDSAAAKSLQHGSVCAGRRVPVVHDSWSSGSMLTRQVDLWGTGQSREQTCVQVTFSNKDEVIKLSPLCSHVIHNRLGGGCCGGPFGMSERLRVSAQWDLQGGSHCRVTAR